MKKAIAMISLIPFMASCNMGIGIGSYKWDKIHIATGDDIGRCYEITKWYDNDTGIEVDLKGYGHLYLSEGTTYFLVGNKCPICDR